MKSVCGLSQKVLRYIYLPAPRKRHIENKLAVFRDVKIYTLPGRVLLRNTPSGKQTWFIPTQFIRAGRH